MQDKRLTDSRALPSDREVRAFHDAGRDLIGIALRSLEVAGGGLSLPKFRMLLVLSELGRVPSSRVADALEVNASSVTRLADRLVEEGHIDRGADEHSRSVVTLELSGRGRELVDRVVTWRHDELARLIAQIDPARRATTAQGLEEFVSAAGSAYSTKYRGPVAL